MQYRPAWVFLTLALTLIPSLPGHSQFPTPMPSQFATPGLLGGTNILGAMGNPVASCSPQALALQASASRGWAKGLSDSWRKLWPQGIEDFYQTSDIVCSYRGSNAPLATWHSQQKMFSTTVVPQEFYPPGADASSPEKKKIASNAAWDAVKNFQERASVAWGIATDGPKTETTAPLFSDSAAIGFIRNIFGSTQFDKDGNLIGGCFPEPGSVAQMASRETYQKFRQDQKQHRETFEKQKELADAMMKLAQSCTEQFPTLWGPNAQYAIDGFTKEWKTLAGLVGGNLLLPIGASGKIPETAIASIAAGDNTQRPELGLESEPTPGRGGAEHGLGVTDT